MLVDIDSDNDGIVDNFELQSDADYHDANSVVDSDGDGILDGYDPNEGGTTLFFPKTQMQQTKPTITTSTPTMTACKI